MSLEQRMALRIANARAPAGARAGRLRPDAEKTKGPEWGPFAP